LELDASSAFQDSLPVTSDQILEMLTEKGFVYQRIDHIPLRTVADSKQVRDGFLTTQQGGGHIKNLYLRDKKKNSFLLVLPELLDRPDCLLAQKLGCLIIWAFGQEP
jgi:Ala-tRNA(Pro) deacylase